MPSNGKPNSNQDGFGGDHAPGLPVSGTNHSIGMDSKKGGFRNFLAARLRAVGISLAFVFVSLLILMVVEAIWSYKRDRDYMANHLFLSISPLKVAILDARDRSFEGTISLSIYNSGWMGTGFEKISYRLFMDGKEIAGRDMTSILTQAHYEATATIELAFSSLELAGLGMRMFSKESAEAYSPGNSDFSQATLRKAFSGHLELRGEFLIHIPERYSVRTVRKPLEMETSATLTYRNNVQGMKIPFRFDLVLE